MYFPRRKHLRLLITSSCILLSLMTFQSIPTARRLTSENSCVLKPAVEPPPGTIPIIAASYPGSGAKMTWNLIEALTGFWTGDDWFNNGREKNVVSTKTHYPHTAGRMVPFEGEIQRALILIRHPMDAIPSYHNYMYEVENNLPLHSTRAPVDAWILWRDSHFESELNIWKESIIYWMDSFSQEDRMVIFYENIVEDHTGPSDALKLSQFLGRTPGVETVDKERAECVWRAIVRYHETGEGGKAGTIVHTRRLEETSKYIERPEQENYIVMDTSQNSPKFLLAGEMESSPSDAKVVGTSERQTPMGAGDWTENEHSTFLLALNSYGPVWEKIAAEVKTRTVEQTSAHALNYFRNEQERNASNPEQIQPDDEHSSEYHPMTVEEADSTSHEGEAISENEGEFSRPEQQILEVSLPEQMQPEDEHSSEYSLMIAEEDNSTSHEGETIAMSVNKGEFSPSEQQMLWASIPEQMQPDSDHSSEYRPMIVEEADSAFTEAERAAMSETEGKFSLSGKTMLGASIPEQMHADVVGNEEEFSPSEQQMLGVSTLEQMQPDGEQFSAYFPMTVDEGADNAAPKDKEAVTSVNEWEYLPPKHDFEVSTLAQTQPDKKQFEMYRPNPDSFRSGPMDKPYTWNQHTLILGVLRELRIRYDGSEIMDMFDIYIQRVLYNRK